MGKLGGGKDYCWNGELLPIIKEVCRLRRESTGGRESVDGMKVMSLVRAKRSLTGMNRSLMDARKKIGRMTFIGLIFKLILYTQ